MKKLLLLLIALMPFAAFAQTLAGPRLTSDKPIYKITLSGKSSLKTYSFADGSLYTMTGTFLADIRHGAYQEFGFNCPIFSYGKLTCIGIVGADFNYSLDFRDKPTYVGNILFLYSLR